jgi:hypothetical protein
MSTSPLSPQDIRAAAEVHRELGPEYSDAVVASFLEKVDREIDARVEARLAGTPQTVPAKRDTRRALWTGIAIGVAVSGIPLILIALTNLHVARQMVATRTAFPGPGGGTVTQVVANGSAVRPGWLLLWLVVVAICAAGAVLARRRPTHRGPQ